MKYAKEKGGFSRVFPRAWPMGFAAAPGVAQAVTMAMLLAKLEYKKAAEGATVQEVEQVEKWNQEAGEDRSERIWAWMWNKPWMSTLNGFRWKVVGQCLC